MALLTMTIFSTALAATTSVMAWRLARREAWRSEARVAALASAIYGPVDAVSLETSTAMASFPSEVAAVHAAAIPVTRVTGRRFLAMASASGLVVAGLLLMAVTKQGGGAFSEASAATPIATRSSTRPAVAAPLELIALSHERAKDALIVRGAIRNPSNGTACDMPVVVVLAFDKRGIFLGSSESDASSESLPPGAGATFGVSVPAKTASPARYKVSFRSPGGVVPHVDRRVPDAATGRIDSAPAPPRHAPAVAAVPS